MITATYTLMILYYFPGRVRKYVFKHYETDTLKITNIWHSKKELILELTYLTKQ